jgi:mevalonate kinase
MISIGTSVGKIILAGEYSVVFGFPGLAIPSKQRTTAAFTEHPEHYGVDIVTSENLQEDLWQKYIQNIVDLCEKSGFERNGTLKIETELPPGKGMGSSTSVVIAIARCLLGKSLEQEARNIEDRMNPGHSGLDFAVIWNEKPVRYVKGSKPKDVTVPENLLSNALLIDTGSPNETTTELVHWVTERKDEPNVHVALEHIGGCADRLLRGDDPLSVFRDHHRAQVALGVVPDSTQKLIAKIEEAGGAAKVIGAGARSGGGGMVMVMGLTRKQLTAITSLPVMPE